MKLALSSAAAPDATLADLLAACDRRGLAALELVEGDAHGVTRDIDAASAEAVRAAAQEAGVQICAFQIRSIEVDDLQGVAQLSVLLGTPVIASAEGHAEGVLRELIREFTAVGGKLLLTHRTDPAAVASLRRSLLESSQGASVGLAWEVRPDTDALSLVSHVLEEAGGLLRYVRLHGGGPESALQTGRGVGTLMARLTLARYSAPLVLTPSTPRYHQAWQAWLGRAGGWGCGSKQSDDSLVTLNN